MMLNIVVVILLTSASHASGQILASRLWQKARGTFPVVRRAALGPRLVVHAIADSASYGNLTYPSELLERIRKRRNDPRQKEKMKKFHEMLEVQKKLTRQIQQYADDKWGPTLEPPPEYVPTDEERKRWIEWQRQFTLENIKKNEREVIEEVEKTKEIMQRIEDKRANRTGKLAQKKVPTEPQGTSYDAPNQLQALREREDEDGVDDDNIDGGASLQIGLYANVFSNVVRISSALVICFLVSGGVAIAVLRSRCNAKKEGTEPFVATNIRSVA